MGRASWRAPSLMSASVCGIGQNALFGNNGPRAFAVELCVKMRAPHLNDHDKKTVVKETMYDRDAIVLLC